MAHLITIRENGFAETAFSGETPWHGLGQTINPDATVEEWIKQAGMEWKVMNSPVLYMDGQHEFEGQQVLYRSDTLAPLSVVSDRYHAVQPNEVLEFFSNLSELGGFKIQVAGTLDGGRKLWALANTGRFAEVCKDDTVGGYLLLSTSCDRSLATTARFTSVRVVCNNTLQMAMKENNHVVSIKHLTKFNPDVLQARLMNVVGSFGDFIAVAKELQRAKMSVKQAQNFVAKLVAPLSQVQNADITKNRTYAKIINLFDGEAKGQSLVGHTKWGMLNAVTEYFDHHKPARTTDARLNSAWFGTGDGVKNKAMQLLQAA